MARAHTRRCLQLLKSIYDSMVPDRLPADGTLTSTSRLDGGERYLVVNSEQIFFMKREGKHFIIHGLVGDDMMHIATNNKLKNKLMEKYSRDFNITGGGFMKSFLGMAIERSNRSIKLHFDHYVCEMLNEYKVHIKNRKDPSVFISQGGILRPEDSPTLPDPSKQKFYRSLVTKLQFAASWIRFDVSFAISQLARFSASAGATHWAALYHLMENVEGLPSFKITYHRRIKHLQDLLSGYADSDCGNSSSRRSISGNLMLYNQAPIMWRSKMQKTTALMESDLGKGGVLFSIDDRN